MKRNILLLGIIIIMALFLRAFQLEKVSLYGDELTMAYDAYSLLLTGKDQLGDAHPLTFKMGAGRPAGYVYASIPFVAIFGPSEWGIRMLSVLSGVGLVVLVFYLGRRLVDEKVGFAAAILMTISPWDLNLSRGGFEAHFALFLSVLGVFFLFLLEKKTWLLVGAAIAFGVAIHTYPTYKLTLPLILIPVVVYIGLGKFRSCKLILPGVMAGVILVISVGSAIAQTLSAGSEARFQTINIFSQEDLRQGIIQNINSQRQLSQLPRALASLFHNQSLAYSLLVGENYLKNFSLDFLFLHGDGNPRHNMSTMGELFIAELILVVAGLIYLGKNYRRELILLLIWLLIAPIPTALTDDPHALRSSLMLPPLILLSAAGLIYLLKIQKLFARASMVVIILMIALQFTFFVERFYYLAPREFSRFWSYPAKLASELIIENRRSFDYIIVSDSIDNIEFAYPVYRKVPPSLLISQNIQRSTMGGYSFKKLDNVYIGHIPGESIKSFLDKLDGKILYLGNDEEKKYLSSFETREGIDKKSAFIISRHNRSTN